MMMKGMMKRKGEVLTVTRAFISRTALIDNYLKVLKLKISLKSCVCNAQDMMLE